MNNSICRIDQNGTKNSVPKPQTEDALNICAGRSEKAPVGETSIMFPYFS